MGVAAIFGSCPFSHLTENATSYRSKCGTNGKPVCDFLNFTALHGMQTRSSDENSVYVSSSVKCVNCEKTEENSVQIFISYERSF